jgi:hypothetical protein
VFNGNNLQVTGDSGFAALIGVDGNGDSVSGGSVGNDTIWQSGNDDTIAAGPGSDLKGIVGNNDLVVASSGNDTIWAIGNQDTVDAGAGADLIGIVGNGNNLTGGGSATIMEAGSNFTFIDKAGTVYNDTITGFDQAAGDRISLAAGDTVASTQTINGGQDTLITLIDHSTITLKGVADINSSFFK